MKGNNLNRIKESLESHLGEKIILRANTGRKRITENEGIIEGAYQNIFTVKVKGSSKYNSLRTESYSYTDVLTETVQIILFDEELGSETGLLEY